MMNLELCARCARRGVNYYIFLLACAKHEYAKDISINCRFIGLLILTLQNNSELHSIKFNFNFFSFDDS